MVQIEGAGQLAQKNRDVLFGVTRPIDTQIQPRPIAAQLVRLKVGDQLGN